MPPCLVGGASTRPRTGEEPGRIPTLFPPAFPHPHLPPAPSSHPFTQTPGPWAITPSLPTSPTPSCPNAQGPHPLAQLCQAAHKRWAHALPRGAGTHTLV